jgi:hypothetical protein
VCSSTQNRLRIHISREAPYRDRQDDPSAGAHGRYEIERDGHKVAAISKRWFRLRDTYGIEIAPDQDDALILAATVCIDEMSHD